MSTARRGRPTEGSGARGKRQQKSNKDIQKSNKDTCFKLHRREQMACSWEECLSSFRDDSSSPVLTGVAGHLNRDDHRIVRQICISGTMTSPQPQISLVDLCGYAPSPRLQKVNSFFRYNKILFKLRFPTYKMNLTCR